VTGEGGVVGKGEGGLVPFPQDLLLFKKPGKEILGKVEMPQTVEKKGGMILSRDF